MIAQQYEHLIFFDSDCPLCRSSVKKIIQIDHRKIFCFSPLTGVTAQDFLKLEYQKLINLNSLVLVENFAKEAKYWIRSRGFFRILWLIGGFYKTFGVLYLLPAFLTDWVYKMVAGHRHKFFNKQDHSLFIANKEQDRFLP